MNRRIASPALLALAVAVVVPASAAADVTFHVNSTKDAPDQTAVDGKCLATNGKCTLRAAVTEANLEPGTDTIKLPKGKFKLTIPGTGGVEQGDLDVTEAVDIVGKSPRMTRIVQTAHDRILEIDGGLGETTIKGVTLTGGRGATEGGAVYASSPLDIEYSHLLRNRSYSVDLGGARGGAVYAYPSLVMKRDLVAHNEALATEDTADGGGVDALATGSGRIQIQRSLIKDNSATMKKEASDAVGGGLAISGPARIDQSTIAGNHASSAGGIFENGDDTENVTQTLISNNRASDGGGGIQASAMIIVNSTLTGNRVTDGQDGGGAILRFAGSIIVAYSTIAGNDSKFNAGGIESNDPAYKAGTVALEGTVLADNGDLDCHTSGVSPAPGAFTSFGYNVASDQSCGFAAAGDVQGKNSKLKPLADNGGPTMTMALKKGSPALGRGGAGCPATDQRGKPRPSTGCDSGAYER